MNDPRAGSRAQLIPCIMVLRLSYGSISLSQYFGLVENTSYTVLKAISREIARMSGDCRSRSAFCE